MPGGVGATLLHLPAFLPCRHATTTPGLPYLRHTMTTACLCAAPLVHTTCPTEFALVPLHGAFVPHTPHTSLVGQHSAQRLPCRLDTPGWRDTAIPTALQRHPATPTATTHHHIQQQPPHTRDGRLQFLCYICLPGHCIQHRYHTAFCPCLYLYRLYLPAARGSTGYTSRFYHLVPFTFGFPSAAPASHCNAPPYLDICYRLPAPTPYNTAFCPPFYSVRTFGLPTFLVPMLPSCIP